MQSAAFYLPQSFFPLSLSKNPIVQSPFSPSRHLLPSSCSPSFKQLMASWRKKSFSPHREASSPSQPDTSDLFPSGLSSSPISRTQKPSWRPCTGLHTQKQHPGCFFLPFQTSSSSRCFSSLFLWLSRLLTSPRRSLSAGLLASPHNTVSR